MTIYVIYHGYDLDGRCAAAIVRKFAAGTVKLQAVYHAYQLEPYVIAAAQAADLVYVLDWSPQDISLLHTLNTNVLWIDHHAVAMKNYEEWSRATGHCVAGLRGDDGACLLTWHLLCGETPPQGVIDIAAADVARATSEMMDFVKGISCCPTYALDHGNETTWERCLSDDKAWYEERCREGRAVRDYEKYNPKQRRSPQTRIRALLEGVLVEVTAPNSGFMPTNDLPLVVVDATMMLMPDKRYVLGYKLSVFGSGSDLIIRRMLQTYPTSVGGGHAMKSTIVMDRLPQFDFDVPRLAPSAAMLEI
jgi:hypothetical protein